MKTIFLTLCLLLSGLGAARAQRLQAGLRAGATLTDYRFSPVRFGERTFSSGPMRAGYDVGFVVRWNLTSRLHLQSELDYGRSVYGIRTSRHADREIRIRADRLTVPVEVGFQLGVVRLFGGAQFRVAQGGKSDKPDLLRIAFNDGDVAVMGGIGLNIRKFFIDLRASGYPRGRVWQHFTSQGETQRVMVSHDIVYGCSMGFFF